MWMSPNTYKTYIKIKVKHRRIYGDVIIKLIRRRLSSFSVMLAKVPYIKLFSVQCKKNISPKNVYTIVVVIKFFEYKSPMDCQMSYAVR